MPGFIQGLSKDQLMNLLRKNIKRLRRGRKVKSVSKDGSAFDGNQKLLVRNLIAKAFYD